MRKIIERLKLLAASAPEGTAAAAFAACLAVYAVTVCAPPALDLRYSLYGDVVNMYWMPALWDRSLFPGDKLAAFCAHRVDSFSPEAVWVWFTGLFALVKPYTVGFKLLSVLACAASAFMVHRTGLRSREPRLAAPAAALFPLLFLSMDSFFGLPRVYGALVVIGFALAVESRRFLLLPALTALSFAVYPSACPGLAVSSVLAPFFFRAEFADRRLLRRYLAVLAACAALCLPLLASSVVANSGAQSLVGSRQFEAYKFSLGLGRPVDFGSPRDLVVYFILNLNEHGDLFHVTAGLLVLLAAAGLLRSRALPVLPRFVPLMLCGGAAAFALLYPMHPVIASRQLVLLLPLTLLFLAADGALRLPWTLFRPAPLAASAALVFVCLHPFLNEMISLRRYAGVYDFLSSRPGAAAAGYPRSELSWTVPVFTPLRTLASSETEEQEQMFVATEAEIKARRRTLLEALYCIRPGARVELAGRYGVDWLIFQKRYYAGSFLYSERVSGTPYAEALSDALARSGDPEACYASARDGAAFAWDDPDGGGFLLDLRGGRRP